jgi:hypothetical protein
MHASCSCGGSGPDVTDLDIVAALDIGWRGDRRSGQENGGDGELHVD